MRISELIATLPKSLLVSSRIVRDAEVSSIDFDSRSVKKDSLFVAIRGSDDDGHRFLQAAAGAGACALVVEDKRTVPDDVTCVVVRDARAALGRLAAAFYDEPSKDLFIVGVTGTNGKTTTALMVEAILTEIGLPTGVIGTIDHHLKVQGTVRTWPTEMTTPNPVEFQRRLREFATAGARAAAIEATSHALDQRRVDDVSFDVAIFTNLTRDHLDYHVDMEAYFQAKSRLFTELLKGSPKPSPRAVINVEDPAGARLADVARGKGLAVWTTGPVKSADFRFLIRKQGFAGTTFLLETPVGSQEFELRLPGEFMVSNAVGAIAAGVAAGASLADCARALQKLAGVCGRLEPIENARGVHVFVDFAHTDSALASVLGFLNKIRMDSAATVHPRIATVFGCGGDRDRGKRPLMMAAALAGSDRVILTSDNPRTEDPLAILAGALAGAGDRLADVLVEVDRRTAIGRAIAWARPGDVVLIAGKGHESTQQIGAAKRPFSDQATARKFLS